MKEFKLTKDDGVDKDAALKFIEANTKEAFWKEPAKAALEKCFKEVNDKKDELLKTFEKAPFNVKKDQCNMLFNFAVHCFGFDLIRRCPKEAWTPAKNCEENKAWLDKCTDTVSIMRESIL